MAGSIDKKNIKKIEEEIKKFKIDIKENNIDTNLLKGILGKDGILVRSCNLGHDRTTGFHTHAKSCRAAYKSRKFFSMNKHTDSLITNMEIGQNDYKNIQNIKNKISKSQKRTYESIGFDVQGKLAGRCSRLKNENQGVTEEFPNASDKDFKKYLLKVDQGASKDVIEAVNEHNEDVKGCADEYEKIKSFYGFLEKSHWINWGKAMENAFSNEFIEMVKNTHEQSKVWVAISSPIRVPFNTVLSAAEGAWSILSGLSFLCDAATNPKHKALLDLKKSMKKLMKYIKHLESTTDKIKHSADYLVQDSEQKIALGNDLKKYSDAMLHGTNEEFYFLGVKCSKNKGDGLDSEHKTAIRKCRKKVANLISQLAIQLASAQTN